MTNDDLIAKAAQAVADEFYRMQGGDPTWPEAPQANEGDYAIAAAAIAAVRDQIAAEALREAADEIHREARWQTEQQMRNAGTPSASQQHYYMARRLAVVESVLRARADRLAPKE